MDSDAIIFSAPGKVILFGEHAVVYGHPAIVMAINLRARCITSKSSRQTFTLDPPEEYPDDLYVLDEEEKDFVLEKRELYPVLNHALYFIAKTIMEKSNLEKYPHISIKSDIPSASGLGSSAAVAVTTIASTADFVGLNLSLEEINEIAFQAESYTHRNPSGVDNTVATFGGLLYYKRRNFNFLIPNISSSCFVIVNSGNPRNTSQYVEKVALLTEKEPKKYNEILENIGNLTEEAKNALTKGDTKKLGILMNQNHQYLEELGVGHPILSSIRKKLEKEGSLGSKLTGAGGGGCVIGLFDEYRKAEHAVREIKNKGFQAFISSLSEKGVKRE